MATAPAVKKTHGRRRAKGEDAIYFDASKNCYVGAVSLGFGGDGSRVRRKVRGKTKAEVRQKLKALRAELDVGVTPPANYTVRAAVDGWLAHGLSGRSERTVQLYRDGVKPLVDVIGGTQLRKLTAANVRVALAELSGRMSTRSLQIAHNCLVRAIRHAEADDLIGRNVAALVRPPAGQEGRPSKALTAEQARALLRAAAASGDERRTARSWSYAYVVLLLTTGLRPEEARALRWDHVDLEAGTLAVWRSDRAGGDTKTAKSRRTLRLATTALQALRERKVVQAAERLRAGAVWEDHGLVFTTAIGTMLDQHNIRREFRRVTEAAGLGSDWVPRELRHTFVSIMSENGVPVEEIARLARHDRTTTTEVVYRHELRPVIATGAEIMDRILG
ncbi:MAG TPA: tyrosine-type recombinase/integrase [Streptosporangiaceae bacterium]|nr:tyrosine-type recombinase/integrase [Streptosporangiaceae bacterium]